MALAWLLAQHPRIVPIPGTTKIHRLQENSAAVDVELTPEDLEEITAAADGVDVQGSATPHTCNGGSIVDPRHRAVSIVA